MVLIIGILSAIALPQYTKAVEKSRVAEAKIMLKALHENRQLCKLEFGENANECKDLFEHLTIELPGEVLSECIDLKCVNTKDWQYGIDTDDGLMYANRVINGDTEHYPYYINLEGDGSLSCDDTSNKTATHNCTVAGF